MTKKVIHLNPGMTPQAFQQAVRDRAAFSHMVGFTDHALERMQARSITRTMVLRVLRRGSIDGPRMKQDRASGNWTAPIVGVTAGIEIKVVVAIEDGTLFVTVITAYGG